MSDQREEGTEKSRSRGDQHALNIALSAHHEMVAQIRAAFPDENEESLCDTIEGESNLSEAIAAVLRAALESAAMADGIDAMIEKVQMRKRRLAARATALRAAALQAMQDAGMKKLSAPDMTVSIGHSKPRVIITEPDMIPDHLCKIIREPSKTAIGAELAAGRDVPGATLGNPQSFLTIHGG